ncbi:hypothetical protein [Salibacterium lacus]|uniref:Uncharacterized protein n=1 Tax=Salibacterium lacus TaxID=1898109 RepID=A0ABW5SYD7_9BACI
MRATSLWNDSFTIEYADKGKVIEKITFKGSLRGAMRHVLHKYDYGCADFYTSDGKWLKEIMW